MQVVTVKKQSSTKMPQSIVAELHQTIKVQVNILASGSQKLSMILQNEVYHHLNTTTSPMFTCGSHTSSRDNLVPVSYTLHLSVS